jgi:hypothetical protein
VLKSKLSKELQEIETKEKLKKKVQGDGYEQVKLFSEHVDQKIREARIKYEIESKSIKVAYSPPRKISDSILIIILEKSKCTFEDTL